MRRALVLILARDLSGCGAEVTGGAAKAMEAEQAQKQKERIQQRLDAATELERQRRAAWEEQ